MRKIKQLLLIFIVVLAKNSYAQQAGPLKLSTNYPEAGKKLSITYDTAGTLLAGKSPLTATLYCIDNNQNPVVETKLERKGNFWACDITLPDSAKVFAIKIAGTDTVDNNNGLGYIYLVYKHKKPIRGAYAAEAGFYGIGSHFGLKPDNDRILAAYNNEKALYPSAKYDGDRYELLLRMHKIEMPFVMNKIDSLAKTGSEADLESAVDLSYITRKKSLTDSLSAIAVAKNPRGNAVKFMLEDSLISTPGVAKKDSIYNLMLEKFPSDKLMLGEYAEIPANAHLKNADFAGFNKYKSMMGDTTELAGVYNSVAYDWAQAGTHTAEAERLSKESIDIVQAKIDNPKPNFYHTAAEVKKDNLQTLDYYLDTYALILYNEGRYAEGAKLEAPVWERAKPDSSIGGHYALLLLGNKDYTGAANVIEEIIKAGNGSDTFTDELKTSYIGKNGSDKGFDPYITSLDSIGVIAARNKMLSDPAPDFSLKDLDGNTVSLASLKGKTVVVDFWATWCGPCKASMPGMQLAVNKYKNDPLVEFLFVDTWENGTDFVPGVKKFIADNKYSFHVLLDDMDSEGKQGKVVDEFKVEGIPTKFVIDKNGIIRFKYLGYDGTPEGLVTEISKWIDMIK